MIKVKVMWKSGTVTSETFTTNNQLAFYILGLGDVGVDAIIITYA